MPIVFNMFCNKGCTQSLVVSCKYWVVALISSRVSVYSQVILSSSWLFSYNHKSPIFKGRQKGRNQKAYDKVLLQCVQCSSKIMK